MKKLRRLVESLISSTEIGVYDLVLADFYDGYRALPTLADRRAYCRRWLRMYGQFA